MFNFVKEKLVNFQPQIVKTDFEYAAILDFKEVFTWTQISGCNFHHGQSIFWGVTNIRLKTTYETDINVKKFAKSLSWLAYVRRGEVLSTFNRLKND